MQFQLSGIIVGLNELNHLKIVLPQLSKNIEDLHYFDLGSIDGSVEFAKNIANCTVHEINTEKTVEIIHFKYSDWCKYDWIIYIDPDERWPRELFYNINLYTCDESVGMISAGIHFYFKNHKLKGTRWGGIKVRGVAFHKKRINLSSNVHRSKSLKNGFKNKHIKDKVSIIDHYWMDNYSSLFSKHLRYIDQEGHSRYENGFKTNLINLIIKPFVSFKDCYWNKKGYKDGLKGLFLSFFWAWYNTAADYKLYKIQKLKVKNSF